MALFGQLNAQGITIIIVTHEIEVARGARRVLTIRDGVLASDDHRQKTNDE
jgi:ABC-type ATPase involved in cell division